MNEDAFQDDEADRLVRSLAHYDPPQLWFQVNEIVRDRCYLRHGVRVNEGDVVLDVGANVGVAAVFFADICRAGAVHSFEPVPQLFDLLLENVGSYSACTAHAFGLSREAGDADLTFYPSAAAMSGRYADAERDSALVRRAMENMGQDPVEIDAALADRYEGKTVRCELRRLSTVIADLGLQRIDLLKIDVERGELDVLAGLTEDDWTLISQLAVEVHDDDGRAAAVSADLRDRGYDVSLDQEEAMRGTGVRVLFASSP